MREIGEMAVVLSADVLLVLSVLGFDVTDPEGCDNNWKGDIWLVWVYREEVRRDILPGRQA